jgi:hypothetical protein
MQFKARMEKPIEGFHAIEVWFEADNIIAAGNLLMDRFSALAIEPGSVTLLVEQPSREDQKTDAKIAHARRAGEPDSGSWLR